MRRARILAAVGARKYGDDVPNHTIPNEVRKSAKDRPANITVDGFVDERRFRQTIEDS